MWWLAALFSGGILASEAIRKSRIPEFGTDEYYRKTDPNMTADQRAMLRFEMGKILSEPEKRLVEARTLREAQKGKAGGYGSIKCHDGVFRLIDDVIAAEGKVFEWNS